MLGTRVPLDDAELIIAELVGNAVRHGLRTGPQIISLGKEAPALRLCLLRRIGEVMLAVTDPSDEAPAPKAPSADGESGRGLQIVGALSYVWGWSPIEGNGKAVWAVLKSAVVTNFVCECNISWSATSARRCRARRVTWRAAGEARTRSGSL